MFNEGFSSQNKRKRWVSIINHERTLAMIFLIILCGFLILHNLDKPRLLILHSYALDYSWVIGQNEGMQRVLKNQNTYLIKEYYLDTKNKPYPDYMTRAGKEAKNLIKRWKPNVIIACDDDAQKLVGQFFVDDPNIKIIFTGIQGDFAKYGYKNANNVTGVFEKVSLEGIKQTLIELNKNKGIEIKKIFHLSDTSTYSRFVKKEITSFDWQPFTLVNSAEYKTFEDWKNQIKRANQEADILLITNYHTLRRSPEDKSIVTPQEIIEWTENHSSIPGIGSWGFYVEDGGMLALAVSPYEQGEIAAQMAVEILDNKHDFVSIKPQIGKQYIIYMRQSKMERYQLKLPTIYEAFARATNHYFN